MDRADKAFHEWCQDISNAQMIHDHLHKLYEEKRVKTDDDSVPSLSTDPSTEQLADATEGG